MQSPFVAGLVGWSTRIRACTITTNENGGWCRKSLACRSRSLFRSLGAPRAIRYSDIIKRRTPSERTHVELACRTRRTSRSAPRPERADGGDLETAGRPVGHRGGDPTAGG